MDTGYDYGDLDYEEVKIIEPPPRNYLTLLLWVCLAFAIILTVLAVVVNINGI